MSSEPHTTAPGGMLLIISGPSGVGKTTITRAIERAFDDAVFSVSATTRPKTSADVDGVDYFFVTPERFEEMEQAGEFLESAEVFDRRYGTPRAPVIEKLATGRIVILEIDVNGAELVKQRMPEAYGIFVLPPSEDVLLERLRKRRREGEEIIQRRFAEAKREIAQAKADGVYDVFIVNASLEDAVQEAIEAVRDERTRR